MKTPRSKKESMIDYLENHGFENVKDNGNNVMASCPFANERHESGTDNNPSWGISVKTGIWGCFACKSKGNLVTLANELKIPIFDIKNCNVLSFEETLTQIKRKMYIESSPKSFIANLPDNFELFDFNKKDDPALNWLRIDKKYKDSTIKLFGIGKVKNNPVFLFPDENNYIVGWQERNIQKNRSPKYKFTKDFKKTDYLYNYYNTLHNQQYYKKEFKNECVVVEALLSVLALHEVGVPAVSCGGSSISDKQAGMLGAYKSVTICFDNDAAGKIALGIYSEILKKGPFKIFWVMPPYGTKIHRMNRKNILHLINNRKILHKGKT